MPPKLVREVAPVYPEIARQAKVEGAVILEATTDTYGQIASVKVLRSILSSIRPLSMPSNSGSTSP